MQWTTWQFTGAIDSYHIEYLRDITEFASEHRKRTIFCFLISYIDIFSSVESNESLLSNKTISKARFLLNQHLTIRRTDKFIANNKLLVCAYRML